MQNILSLSEKFCHLCKKRLRDLKNKDDRQHDHTNDLKGNKACFLSHRKIVAHHMVSRPVNGNTGD